MVTGSLYLVRVTANVLSFLLVKGPVRAIWRTSWFVGLMAVTMVTGCEGFSSGRTGMADPGTVDVTS